MTSLYRSNSRMTNPMGNGRIWPVYTRHVPSIAFTPVSFFDTFYYMSKFMVVGVDVGFFLTVCVSIRKLSLIYE